MSPREEVYHFCAALFERGVEDSRIIGSEGKREIRNHGGGMLHWIKSPFSPQSAIGFNDKSFQKALAELGVHVFTTSKIVLTPEGAPATLRGRPGVLRRDCNALMLYTQLNNAKELKGRLLESYPAIRGLVATGEELGDLIPDDIRRFKGPSAADFIPVARERLILIAVRSGKPGDPMSIWYNVPRDKREAIANEPP